MTFLHITVMQDRNAEVDGGEEEVSVCVFEIDLKIEKNIKSTVLVRDRVSRRGQSKLLLFSSIH